MADRALTDKQERFCEEYLKDLSVTQAALRAGYAAPNAGIQGSHLLRKEHVQARIAALKSERSKRTHIDQDDVLRGLYREATAGDLDEPNATRVRALELLGKHIGMFTDRKDITIKRIDDMSESELVALVGEESDSAGAVH